MEPHTDSRHVVAFAQMTAHSSASSAEHPDFSAKIPYRIVSLQCFLCCFVSCGYRACKAVLHLLSLRTGLAGPTDIQGRAAIRQNGDFEAETGQYIVIFLILAGSAATAAWVDEMFPF